MKLPTAWPRPVTLRRSGDGHDVLALRQYPSERELRWRAAFFLRQHFHLVHQPQILLEVLALKAGRVAAIVVRIKVVDAFDLPRQEPASEG